MAKNMKRKFITAASFLISFAASAQNNDRFSDGELRFESMHIIGAFFNIALIATIVFIFVKLFLDNHIKNKLLDKGAPQDLAIQLLQPSAKNDKRVTIKWVFILTGLGIGLLVANYTQPIGIHSIAIMCLSLAAGFLGYFLFINDNDKK